MASVKTENIRELLYEYLITLKIDAQEYQKHSNACLGPDIFSLPNKSAFLYVTYFLFDKFDHVQCKKEFEFLWPPLSKKNNSDFLKVAFNWLTNIANKHPEARIPKFTMSLFMTSSGDKLCMLYLAFAVFILQRSLSCTKNVKYLNYPILCSDTKSAAFAVHSAMYENLLSQKDYLEKLEKEAHQNFTDSASVLTQRHRELKISLKSHESSLAEMNAHLCEKFITMGIEDAEKQLDKETNMLLSSVRRSWQQIKEHYNAFLPLRNILFADLRSSGKMLIDGKNYPIKILPCLTAAVRNQLEKENLSKVQDDGKLDLEKLMKLFTIILSTFDKPLKEMESVLNVNKVLPEKSQLKETDKVLENVDKIEFKTVPSFLKMISEQGKLLSTFNTEPKPFFIDDRSYFLQQTKPEVKSSHGNLNDSACSLLMNMSPACKLQSPGSDNVFSPNSRNHFTAASRLAPLKMNLPKSTLKSVDRNALTKLQEVSISNSFGKTADAGETLLQRTTAKRTSSDHNFANAMQGPAFMEDLIFGTSFNTSNASFSPSIMSRDSFNVSLLENQTLPDFPDFDITSEIDASNLLLELDD